VADTTKTPLAILLQELVDQGLTQPTIMPEQFTYPSVLVSVPSIGANSAGEAAKGMPDGQLGHDSRGDQR
jgi:hypothetical protein